MTNFFFPSNKGKEMEYMPLHSKIAREKYRAQIRDTLLGGFFLVITIGLLTLLFSVV